MGGLLNLRMNPDSSLMFPRKIDPSVLNPQLKDCRLLPQDFEPLPYSVIIGRGNITKDSIGNRRLDVLASSFLSRYAESTSKAEKTGIVSEIVSTIRNACKVGAFIRFVNDRWWEVDDSAAREKVGYCLRNLLHDKYSTSAKSKSARRKERKQKRLNEAARVGGRGLPTAQDTFARALQRTSATAMMIDHTMQTRDQDQRSSLVQQNCALYQGFQPPGSFPADFNSKVISTRLHGIGGNYHHGQSEPHAASIGYGLPGQINDEGSRNQREDVQEKSPTKQWGGNIFFEDDDEDSTSTV